MSKNKQIVGIGILGDPGADKGGGGKSKRAEKYIWIYIFRPFRLSLVPTICPWVSEDGA